MQKIVFRSSRVSGCLKQGHALTFEWILSGVLHDELCVFTARENVG